MEGLRILYHFIIINTVSFAKDPCGILSLAETALYTGVFYVVLVLADRAAPLGLACMFRPSTHELICSRQEVECRRYRNGLKYPLYLPLYLGELEIGKNGEKFCMAVQRILQVYCEPCRNPMHFSYW